MHSRATVLIVDRNPNVLDYLERELVSEGYTILSAEDCREVFAMINRNTPFEIIIIDPDLPDAEEEQLFRKLQSLRPRTSIVIHTIAAEYLNHCRTLIEAVYIEKDGNSIERIKAIIAKQLRRPPPTKESLHYG